MRVVGNTIIIITPTIIIIITTIIIITKNAGWQYLEDMQEARSDAAATIVEVKKHTFTKIAKESLQIPWKHILQTHFAELSLFIVMVCAMFFFSRVASLSLEVLGWMGSLWTVWRCDLIILYFV